MSEKRKFSKLRLPSSTRGTSHSQISKFFAQSQSEGNKPDNENSNSNPNAPKNKHEILSLPNPAPSVPIIDIPEDAAKSSLQSFEYTSTKEIKHRRVPARSSSKNTIKEFFNQSTSENDFEIPKKVTKKPVRKPGTATQRKKTSATGTSKRQPKIKSLLQKEQLLSEFIAEQSFAEHIDPNEMQMALALSRSEVETCRIDDDQDAFNENSNSTESIRQSLEQFGYKLNKNVKDNHSIYASSRSRAKWANKFTSLTMRNSDRQQEKVNKKIETFLELQYTHAEDTEHLIGDKFTMGSGFLSSMKPHQPTFLRHSFDPEPHDIGQFYVTDVFQPTTLKVGNLLKDFRTIPGRDLSPVKSKEQRRSDVEEKASNGLLSPEKIQLATEPCSSRHEAKEKIVRQSSPDLFDDFEMEELEEVEAVSGTESSTMKSLGGRFSNSDRLVVEKLENCAMKTSENVPVASLDREENLIESIAVETISILDSSSSNDAANDIFSRDEDTAKSAHPDERDDTTVDLTQEDDEEQHENSQSHHKQLSQLINTSDRMSINSNEDQNQSQESSSSIIILSDDEVNYSMKVIKGLDISLNSSSQSVDKNVRNPPDAKKDANKLCFESDSQVDKESCCVSPVAGPSCKNYDGNISSYSDDIPYNIQANEITMKNHDKHNYTLAHEIMIDSFLEESEKSNMNKGSEQSTTLPRTTTEEMQFLDLTQSSPKSIDSIELCPGLEDNTTSRQYNNSVKYSKSHSDSFLLSKTLEPLKRFSSSRKFSEFAKNDSDFSDTDEFDRLVYGSPRKKQLFQYPQGLTQLLTGNINSKNADESFEEFTADSKTYLVKTRNVKTKPDYSRMDSPTRLNELYKHGLKPLKRKQALIMLEYIYNQTHPYVVEGPDEDDDRIDIVLSGNDVEKECFDKEMIGKHNIFNLRDCFGTCLLKEDELRAEIDQEIYVLPTNSRAKIPTVLLPLHVAWFNLIKSNEKLLEAVLCYVPIDLQEIYVFFKSIGYRYDPKDIKSFFDGRSIIFQYDLNKEGTNRHVRKARRQLSQKSSKFA